MTRVEEMMDKAFLVGEVRRRRGQVRVWFFQGNGRAGEQFGRVVREYEGALLKQRIRLVCAVGILAGGLIGVVEWVGR